MTEHERWIKENEAKKAKWLENEHKGIWQSASAKPEWRTPKEIEADFLKYGFQ